MYHLLIEELACTNPPKLHYLAPTSIVDYLYGTYKIIYFYVALDTKNTISDLKTGA